MEPVTHIAAYYSNLARQPMGRRRKEPYLAQEARRLSGEGLSPRKIGSALGLNHETVRRILREAAT